MMHGGLAGVRRCVEKYRVTMNRAENPENDGSWMYKEKVSAVVVNKQANDD